MSSQPAYTLNLGAPGGSKSNTNLYISLFLSVGVLIYLANWGMKRYSHFQVENGICKMIECNEGYVLKDNKCVKK